jgi:hypothetical protein
MDKLTKINEIKEWKDRTVEEKLDTLREELLNMRYLNTRLYNVESSVELLFEHEHGNDGKPTQKLKKNYNPTGMGIAMSIDRLK